MKAEKRALGAEAAESGPAGAAAPAGRTEAGKEDKYKK